MISAFSGQCEISATQVHVMNIASSDISLPGSLIEALLVLLENHFTRQFPSLITFGISYKEPYHQSACRLQKLYISAWLSTYWLRFPSRTSKLDPLFLFGSVRKL